MDLATDMLGSCAKAGKHANAGASMKSAATQIAVIAERAPKTTATRLVDRADDLAAYCAGW
jgi:hypothetical protein